ncbi:hypothetical protein EMPS_00870 [Entomortierella parvispora]|uniref:ADP-ribosylglycohydrolase n=1 Tax=Entomortierella parvispora TaxID=205924 RepID=A0A9P3H1W5_9FUNG|nr:hypothetical protein EMPS_00870 [Entomortierella parvispora]
MTPIPSTQSTLTRPEIESRILGCLFGNAVGDAYGLATEFMSKESAFAHYGNGPIAFGGDEGHPVWIDSHRGKWDRNDFTDDTDQMLLILQSLQQTANGRLHPTVFARRLKEWSVIGFPEMETPPRGIGYTVGSTLSHPEFRYNPHRASFDIWNSRGRNLAANGAVMRTSVLGVESFWDETRVVENALAAAKVTHADPRSIISALIASVLISRLLRGGGTNEHADSARVWNPRLRDSEYHEELLEYLRRGTDIRTLDTLDPDYERDIGNEFKRKPVKQSVPPTIKYNFFNTVRGIVGGPSAPVSPKVEYSTKRPRAIARDNIGWAGLDNVGEHDAMTALARSVVSDYLFLIKETDVVPASVTITNPALQRTSEEQPRTIQERWAEQLQANCFPESLHKLELGDGEAMGYAYKCVGAGFYAVTRRIDPLPTDPNYEGTCGFFRGVTEVITLEAGDADTNMAVVGSLLGARHGLEGIPQNWWTGLKHFEFLTETFNEFLARVMDSYEEVQAQQ